MPAFTIDWSKWAPVIIGIVSILFAYHQSNRALNAKRIEDERQEIYKKLNELYGPLLQLRMKSKHLYDIFQEKYRKSDSGFSTLVYLLNGFTFPHEDKVLLQEIITIGEQCESLIHEKAGLIDDSNLRLNIFPRATTHFLLLRLAFSGNLAGRSENFQSLSYPKDMDQLLEKRKKKLEDRLAELNKPIGFF